MKTANFGIIIAKLISVGLLFAALGHHPYDYYTVLRLVACGVAVFTAFQAAQLKRFGWLVVFITIAVVHNPVAPIHLKRDTWALIDIATAVFLLLSIAIIDVRKQS